MWDETKQRRFDELRRDDAAPLTPVERREQLLQQFRTNGVTHVVTQTNASWAAALSWPVVHSVGAWQLRAEKPTP